jgi:hypothetical protein
MRISTWRMFWQKYIGKINVEGFTPNTIVTVNVQLLKVALTCPKALVRTITSQKQSAYNKQLTFENKSLNDITNKYIWIQLVNLLFLPPEDVHTQALPVRNTYHSLSNRWRYKPLLSLQSWLKILYDPSSTASTLRNRVDCGSLEPHSGVSSFLRWGRYSVEQSGTVELAS